MDCMKWLRSLEKEASKTNVWGHCGTDHVLILKECCFSLLFWYFKFQREQKMGNHLDKIACQATVFCMIFAQFHRMDVLHLNTFFKQIMLILIVIQLQKEGDTGISINFSPACSNDFCHDGMNCPFHSHPLINSMIVPPTSCITVFILIWESALDIV